jgi:RNA polymerase sigma factor (sigma-70 family)
MLDLSTIELAQSGDTEAWDRLCRATYDYVKGYLVRKATNYDYAEEAVQEAYLSLLSALPSYDPNRGAFLTWLCGLAWHRLSHIERRERRRAGPEVRADMLRHPGVEHEVMDRMAEQQARNVLALVTPYRRLILELRILRGLPVPEVAAMLGVTGQGVRSGMYHALKELRQRIPDRAHYQTRSDAVLAPTRRNNSGRPLASRKGAS